MIGRLKEITLDRDRNQNVTVTISGDFREEFDKLKDSDVEITIKKASKKRSKDANAFCWAMCTDIGNAMMIPKETVYREAVREVGDYIRLEIREDAVEQHRRNWQKLGIGWFTDVVDFSQTTGYKVVFSYYGSSTYDQETMSRMLEYLIQEMRNLDLPIPLSKADAERVIEQWGR